MKLHILSDLHLEFADFDMPETDADVVIVAGDMHVGDRGIKWAGERLDRKQVVYVPGNHEYYRNAIPNLTEKLKAQTHGTNTHILENEELILGEVRFLGCTLWSDFRLHGNLRMAAIDAGQMMNDYRLIRLSPRYRKIRPADTAGWHGKSRKWLAETLDAGNPCKKKTVVITHHAPSLRSVPARYKNDPLSAAFASDMEAFIADKKIDLWIHGHIHDSSDYTIGSTRVICNPRGYAHEQNPGFLPDMVIEI